MRITEIGGIKNLSDLEVCIIKDLRSMDPASLDATIDLIRAFAFCSRDDEKHNNLRASIKIVSDSGKLCSLNKGKSRQ